MGVFYVVLMASYLTILFQEKQAKKNELFFQSLFKEIKEIANFTVTVCLKPIILREKKQQVSEECFHNCNRPYSFL